MEAAFLLPARWTLGHCQIDSTVHSTSTNFGAPHLLSPGMKDICLPPRGDIDPTAPGTGPRCPSGSKRATPTGYPALWKSSVIPTGLSSARQPVRKLDRHVIMTIPAIDKRCRNHNLLEPFGVSLHVDVASDLRDAISVELWCQIAIAFVVQHRVRLSAISPLRP